MKKEEMSNKQAFEIYSKKPAFKLVGYKQFLAQLTSHRTQVNSEWRRAVRENAAFQQDRQLHPVKAINSQGEPEFHLSEAKKKLREDMGKKMHVGKKPAEFRQSTLEYQEFPLPIIQKQMDQEERYQRYIFWRESDRKEKLEKEKLAMQKDIARREKHFESMKKKEEDEKEKDQSKVQAKASGTAKKQPGGPKRHKSNF